MSWRNRAACLLILLAIAGMSLVGQIRVDNRLERWVRTGTLDQERYETFLETFGSDEFVWIALSGADLFALSTMQAMVEVAEALERLPGVAGVEGFPVLYRDFFASGEIEAFRREVMTDELYQGLFISANGETAGLLLSLDPPRRPEGRRELMEVIRKHIGRLKAHGLQSAYAGSTVLIVSLDEISSTESRRSLAIALLASLAVMTWLFRSIRGMAVAAICAGISVVLTLALVVWTGRALNMITSVLPALLWVLSLSGSIHLLMRYYSERSRGRSALKRAISGVTWPSLLASVTTAAGLFSLMMAGLQPVRELGFFAGTGILLSVAVNLTVGPLLIRWLKPDWRGGLRLPVLRWGFRWPKSVLALTVSVILLSLLSLPRLRIASNPLSFLPDSHPTVQDYHFIGEQLGGFYTLETIIDLPEKWTEPTTWPAIEKLSRELAISPIVSKVRSPLDVLAKARQMMLPDSRSPDSSLPRTRREADAILEAVRLVDPDLFASYVDGSGHRIRISAIVNEMDENRFLDLVQETRTNLGRLPDGFEAHITGQVLQLVEAQQTLVGSQIRSLGLALVVIFACIGVGLRSLRLTWLSILPNVLPLLCSFACMVLFDLPLDAGTVMVASVALGIAVDDTVHLLTEVRREMEPTATFESIIEVAVHRVEGAMVLTTLTACIGFFSLGFSSFLPIRYFGLLSGIAMAVALAADLIVVPAVLSLSKRPLGS